MHQNRRLPSTVGSHTKTTGTHTTDTGKGHAHAPKAMPLHRRAPQTASHHKGTTTTTTTRTHDQHKHTTTTSTTERGEHHQRHLHKMQEARGNQHTKRHLPYTCAIYTILDTCTTAPTIDASPTADQGTTTGLQPHQGPTSHHHTRPHLQQHIAEPAPTTSQRWPEVAYGE